MELIDSHAHLDYDYDGDSVETLIADAKAHGISHIISISAEPDSLERTLDFANRFENIYHTSGIHPHEAQDFNAEIFARVKKCAQSKKCVAIGELGLDFYYDHSPKDVQISALQQQLDFAVEIGKPVVVHAREADSETIMQLAPFAQKWQTKHPGRSPGVIHCFTGTEILAQGALDLGFYISISGIITFKNAQSLRDIVRDIVPVEKLLVETDSPYLAPIPHRGKKNRPQNTKFVAEKVAEIKGISIEELTKITRANTIELFQLPIE